MKCDTYLNQLDLFVDAPIATNVNVDVNPLESSQERKWRDHDYICFFFYDVHSVISLEAI